MPFYARICMWAWCSALVSFASGCLGMPRGDSSPPAAIAADDGGAAEAARGDESGVVPASFEQPAAQDTVVGDEEKSAPMTATQPAFPQQGWWCSDYESWLAPERVEKGYTLIFPGIEGTSWFNISIARGLIDAGCDRAIEINDWTTGYWPMFIYHLMALERNRAQAQEIAGRIVAYQDHYPGRPVTLIGHSGGAAMAVLVLEALPDDRKVDQAILLAGALSPDYDLSRALARTERGITNFYSGGDALYLIAGTLALGTIDRQHSVSAGAVGFRTPQHLSSERRSWYEAHLHQEAYRFAMLRSFNFGGHFGPVNRHFVAKWVAPRLLPDRESGPEPAPGNTL